MSKFKKIIAIDAGKSTGYAEYSGGNDWHIETTDFWGAHTRVTEHSKEDIAVVVEVPSNKAIYHQHGQNSRAMGRTGINVGSVIREAELLAERFLALGYFTVIERPAGKAKAGYVKEVTGCQLRTNQHTRDAVLMAWKNRGLLMVGAG